MIRSVNLAPRLARHRAELDAAYARVMDSGRFILGPEVEAFEREFARYVGAAHAVGVASGTDALHLALRAVGVGTGDEVVTVAHTAIATVAAIEMAGAVPVFVDVDPVHFTLDPARVEAALSARTRAIVPVHLYGQPADMQPLLELSRSRGIPIVEDCAQSHGARWRGTATGALGAAGCFSFYPTKNLGALGDGGMVVTSVAPVAERLRHLREYGWVQRYVSDTAGFNSRLDELQAALLRVGLAHLEADNAERRELAALYHLELQGASVIRPTARADAHHVYHQYVIRSSHRDALRASLRERGVDTLVHYPVPAHLQPAYQGRLRAPGGLAHTEAAAREVLSLPLYPGLTPDEVRTVAAAIHERS